LIQQQFIRNLRPSALKERLFDKASNFGKEYLKLLVNEIRVDKKEVHRSGEKKVGRR